MGYESYDQHFAASLDPGRLLEHALPSATTTKARLKRILDSYRVTWLSVFPLPRMLSLLFPLSTLFRQHQQHLTSYQVSNL